ncbi:MAG: hypothetical protein ACLU79_08795 [Clostridium sp.]
MANILQVTNPALNTETRNIGDNPALNNPLAGHAIKNPVDPSRITRADGRDSGQNSAMTGDNRFGIAGYDSNYGAFIQRLTQGTDLTDLMNSLFAGSRLMAQNDEQVRELIGNLLTSVQFGTPQELAGFLKDQAAEQAKFSGAFFDKMRALLLNGTSSSLKDAAMEFLRAYNDFSSGEHLLRQMESLTKDISSILLSSVRAEYEAMLQEMDWNSPNGQTEDNIRTLYGKLIPFLSRYVAKTHDYGGARSAAMLLIFQAVKYENGQEEHVRKLFERMASNREFSRFFSEEPGGILESLLRGDHAFRHKGGFADAFSGMLLRGMNGEAGLEQVQSFYQLLNGLLLNESVYLPLMHLLLPFQYEDREVMSEMWIDPDAEKNAQEEGGGRKIKFLIRFDIQETGSFELAASIQERKVKMDLSVPPSLMENSQEIQKKVTEIFRNNGMEMGRLLVKEKQGESQLTEIFPEILRKEKIINVRI